jgi:hypothetical protein
MKLDVNKTSKFLVSAAVNDWATLLIQHVTAVPETVMQTCFQVFVGLAPFATVVAYWVEPFRKSHTKLAELLLIPANTLLLLAPKPKSQTLFQFLTTKFEIRNQEQMDMLFGSLSDGTLKKREVPSKNALYDDDNPNGPEACEVGDDAEGVSEPVLPVTSTSS